MSRADTKITKQLDTGNIKIDVTDRAVHVTDSGGTYEDAKPVRDIDVLCALKEVILELKLINLYNSLDRGVDLRGEQDED